MTIKDKKILIGITGGIAAYKVCELIRLFIKDGASVKAVLTPSAKEFVTETTLRTLTKNPVYSDQFEIAEWKPEHISLADEADLFIIAPASANTISKIASGICDNLLTTLVSAYKNPIILAPAMNCNMWSNPFIQENIQKLKNYGFNIIEPEEGYLACGYEGSGRLAGINKIFGRAVELLSKGKPLVDKKIVVTAGGTREPVDPVRFIANKSSGKMGIALADAAYSLGAEVVLISAVEAEKPYKIARVNTAVEMLEEVQKEFIEADSLIMTAAVADYRIKDYSAHKIKKSEDENITLELVKNPDILGEISKIKRDSQTVIGFCAESEDLIENARKKISSKNLDFIVANNILSTETGFGSDYNEVTILDRNGETIEKIPKMTKRKIAGIILEKCLYPESSKVSR